MTTFPQLKRKRIGLQRQPPTHSPRLPAGCDDAEHVQKNKHSSIPHPVSLLVLLVITYSTTIYHWHPEYDHILHWGSTMKTPAVSSLLFRYKPT